MPIAAVPLFLGAALGTYVGWAYYYYTCVKTDGTQCTPEEGGPDWEIVAQLVLGFVGLLPAGLMLWFAFRQRRRAFAASLISALLTYGAWGLVLDAAVHGWARVGPL